jgi:hypothetical protein
MRRGGRGRRGRQGIRGSRLDYLDHVGILAYLGLLLAAPLAAQDPDPRPNECWGFVFGAWSPALDWGVAGHAQHGPRVAPPPAPEASSPAGAPRHDAASFERTGGPALILYPTWWPVGVGITLERQPAAGDTVGGVAHAFVADGRVTPPESRIRAWRTPCNQPPPSVTRAVPDERRSLRAVREGAQPPRHRAARPR